MGEICGCCRSALGGNEHGGGEGAECKRAGTYNQIADENLHNLGLEAGAAGEHALQDVDQDMAKGGADESTVDSHLGDARGEVMAMLVPVLCDPRGEELLQGGESARGQHLGAQRIGLQLLDVGLAGLLGQWQWPCKSKAIAANDGAGLDVWTYSKVATWAGAASEGIANFVHKTLLGWCRADGLVDVELDLRHGCGV